ncbi:hypothetical protein DFQ05_0888 [Winogradskyella wandonensis]|uniref:DUF4258 domain-containing protein n=1 Tax=Winogradskyella wandonensis TaxID=1442586 RepID=A0A4R1KXM8_9FLAO|nr:DUF4258 domain-containing protein [Winogradskyella wandonensis]TCK69367.1 hypothetical protein DFQ05_0888 [Winogradskyella wandonensis]
MKFIHRLGYYLGGLSIGIVILLFFLNGKEASCDYGPNARTVKNITLKTFNYSEDALTAITQNAIDTSTVRELIKYGSVDFSESDTKSKPCKTYKINNTYKNRDVTLKVKNCVEAATILDFKIKS